MADYNAPHARHEPLMSGDKMPTDILIYAGELFDIVGRDAHLDGRDEVADFCSDVISVYEKYNLMDESVNDDICYDCLRVSAVKFFNDIRSEVHIHD